MSQMERSTSPTSGTLSVEYRNVLDLHCGPTNLTVFHFLSEDISNLAIYTARNNNNRILNQLKQNSCSLKTLL